MGRFQEVHPHSPVMKTRRPVAARKQRFLGVRPSLRVREGWRVEV